MLTGLAGFAEFERELICPRASEGRGGAKARGVKPDRKFNLTVYQQPEALVARTP
jgi:DNA invertase Pin-like site-specific DNA recombinase